MWGITINLRIVQTHELEPQPLIAEDLSRGEEEERGGEGRRGEERALVHVNGYLVLILLTFEA